MVGWAGTLQQSGFHPEPGRYPKKRSMPENTNNDASGVDRPTSRPDQEGPSREEGEAKPAAQATAEQHAREMVRGAGQADDGVLDEAAPPADADL
jgi:hypothetical protein